MNDAEREDRGPKRSKAITSKKPDLPPVQMKKYNPDRMHMTKAEAVADKKRMADRKQAMKNAARKFDADYAKDDPKDEAPDVPEAPKETSKAKTPAQVRAAKNKK